MTHERLSYYIEIQGYTKKEFCKKFDFNYDSFVNTLAGKLPLGMKVLKQVKDVLPKLNIEWLLFGNGAMEIKTNDLMVLNEPPADLYKKEKPSDESKINALLTEALKDKNKIINGLEFQIAILTKELEAFKITEVIHIKSDVDQQNEISNNDKKLVK